jgi:hypothetical protein
MCAQACVLVIYGMAGLRLTAPALATTCCTTVLVYLISQQVLAFATIIMPNQVRWAAGPRCVLLSRPAPARPHGPWGQGPPKGPPPPQQQAMALDGPTARPAAATRRRRSSRDTPWPCHTCPKSSTPHKPNPNWLLHKQGRVFALLAFQHLCHPMLSLGRCVCAGCCLDGSEHVPVRLPHQVLGPSETKALMLQGCACPPELPAVRAQLGIHYSPGVEMPARNRPESQMTNQTRPCCSLQV